MSLNLSDVTTQKPVKKEQPSKLRRHKSTKIDALLWRLKARLEPRDDGGHLIGLTSCGRGSGVSTTLANLSIRAADQHLGPVLLIDANTLHPRQHRLFSHKVNVGLADVLSGNTAPAEAVVQTKIEGLDLLPVGAVERLHMSRIVPENHVELIRWVRTNYSLIFVDLPQISELMHSLLFAKCDDLTLVAIRSDMVPRNVVVSQIEQLLADGVNVTGTLLTRRRLFTPAIFRR